MTRHDILKHNLNNIEYGYAIKNIKDRCTITYPELDLASNEQSELDYVLNEQCLIARHAISGAFVWSRTEQGNEYWNEVAEKIKC
jgi:hypothetical protein